MESENTQLLLLLKYLISIQNIKKYNHRIKDLTIELDNLQIELDHIKQELTSTKITENQIISLDKDNKLKISFIN